LIADPINTGENFLVIVYSLITFLSNSTVILAKSSFKYNSSISWSNSAKISNNSILFSSTVSFNLSGMSISLRSSPLYPSNKKAFY